MFHDVLPAARGAGGGPERFTVSVASFELMLDAISATGKVGCALDTALELRDQPRVAITFDDGTAGQFDYAVPALLRRNMTATFFVTTDWVGGPGFMSWDQLRQLAEWGMGVQSHTQSHPHLSELGREQLLAELVASKSSLDRELAQDTTQIALPAGIAPRLRLRALFDEAGYRVVASSRWGLNSDDVENSRGGVTWIRRCTAPISPSPELARRVVSGDGRLAAARRSREIALNGVRAILGAGTYARWRRRVLDAFAAGQ